MIDFCVGRRLSVSNTYLSTGVCVSTPGWPRGRDSVEVKSLTDIVLMKKTMLSANPVIFYHYTPYDS